MYNRRDHIGHWVRKAQPANRHCTHACCRGYREHPEHWPVILPNRKLRGASDQALGTHFQRIANDNTPKARRAELQIIHEFERRDEADRRARAREAQKAAHKEAVAAGRAARRMERESETERLFIEGEAYTRGNWVNVKGRARGIADREILTGREAVFQRYASEEAREFFRSNPRPTASYFRGKDTRILYSDPQARH